MLILNLIKIPYRFNSIMEGKTQMDKYDDTLILSFLKKQGEKQGE
jgi:hypothetical protein